MKRMKTIIISICFFISVFATAQNTKKRMMPIVNTFSNQTIQVKDDNIWDAFKNRRSVRKFKLDSIPQTDILRIIDAARMAPTSGNQQPWKFLIIRDKNKINRMKEACITKSLEPLTIDEKQKKVEEIKNVFDNYFSAPVYIVILTNNNSMYPDYNHWDGPLAAGYLMLAARALGYGTVFITDAIPDAITKSVLNIPDSYTRVCITPLGIPFEWPDSPPKKNLEDFISFENL
jgi:nitroreductase